MGRNVHSIAHGRPRTRNKRKAKAVVAKKEGLAYIPYKLGKVDRIMGPGLDMHVGERCPGCVALYMTLAYERGRQDAEHHRRNRRLAD